MRSEILSWCDHLVSVTLNSVYQGVFVTLLVGCGLRLLGRGNASTRHAAWLVTLALVVSFLPAHYLLGTAVRAPHAADPRARRQEELKGSISTDAQLAEATARAEGGASDGTGVGRSPGLANVSTGAANRNSIGTGMMEQSMPVAGPWDGRGLEPGMKLKPEATMVAASALGSPGSSGSWSARLAGLNMSKLLNPVSWNLSSAWHISRSTGAVLVALWIVLAGARAVALLRRLFQIRSLKRACQPASPDLERQFLRIREDLQVDRSVELRVSTSQAAPILLGFLHPVILMPAPEPQPSDPEVTEQILQHELAHVRRRDDCVNLLQHCVQAVFFFHPAVWWISRRLSLEREIACDDCVLRQGHGPRSYALALANLASLLSGAGSLPAPGLSSNNGQLKQRINMILNTRRDISPRLAKVRLGLLTSTAAVGAVLAVCAFPRLLLAQDPPTAAAAPVPAPAISAQPVVVSDETPRGIDPGAKTKDGDTSNTPRPANAIPAPPSAAAFSRAGGPTPPAEPEAADAPAKPATRPRGPRPPGPGSPGERALMERIDRLERMVQKLMDRENGPRAKGDRGPEAETMRADMARQKKVAESQWRADGEKARAEDQAKRAEANEKRKSEKLAAIEAEAQNRARGRMQSSKIEMGALRQARENLARELEKLDRQIERLERDQQRLEEDSQRRRDGDKPGNDRDGKNKDGVNNVHEDAALGDIALAVDVTVKPVDVTVAPVVTVTPAKQ